MESRIQPWMQSIPTRMFTVLWLGLRGPDTHAAPGIKAICRWLRGVAIKPGNPHNYREFMGGAPPRIREKDTTAKELEFCSQHYYSHLMHALEVVAYCHPDSGTSGHALALFTDMAALMHLPVEPKADFELRLRELEWPGGRQPADFAEAMLIMQDV